MSKRAELGRHRDGVLLAYMHTYPNIGEARIQVEPGHEELTAVACTTYALGVGVAACAIAASDSRNAVQISKIRCS